MPSTILNETHLTQINDALSKIKTAETEIAMAERAGLINGPNGEKLAAYKDQLEKQKGQLLQIKNVYFPNK